MNGSCPLLEVGVAAEITQRGKHPGLSIVGEGARTRGEHGEGEMRDVKHC